MGMDSLKEKIREMEKEEIMNALGECNWVMARAAKKLGITERMIGYKIKKYGIRKEGVEENRQLSASSKGKG
jgi:Nif-specific regulatory protein